uniref:Putative NADH dehydrogenase n=1 Tax=viral metagenome TaxID=1070528 RepID=A0A6H1ZUL4_9ZZZZ
METVIVTGHTGWIGKYAVEILRGKGYRVHLPLGDLLDGIPSLPVATHFLHLSWNVKPGYWDNPENIDWFTASVKLINEFYEDGGKRIVLAGTNVDIGGTLYGRCKGALKTVLDAYRVTGLSTATGRIFYLYGPGEDPNRLISSIIISLLKGQEVVINHPSQMIDFLHVHDVASALCSILDSDVEGSVDIGSGNVTTTLRIAQIIGEIIGRPELIKSANIPSVERIICDTHRLKNEVGWKRKYNLDDGLEDTIEWWRGNL